jgi:hypothetical protein
MVECQIIKVPAVTNWNVQISRSESLDYEEYRLEEIYQEMMAENVNAEEKAALDSLMT